MIESTLTIIEIETGDPETKSPATAAEASKEGDLDLDRQVHRVVR